MSKSKRNTNHPTKTLVTVRRGPIALKQRVTRKVRPSERSDRSAAQRNSASRTSLEIATRKYEVAPVDPAPPEIVPYTGVGHHADLDLLLNELPDPVKRAVMTPALLKDEIKRSLFCTFSAAGGGAAAPNY